MAEPTLLDKTYSVLLRGFVESGQAPHYTEVAAELGVSPGEGREAQRKLFSIRGFPGWLYPKGDTVVSMGALRQDLLHIGDEFPSRASPSV